MLYSARLWRLRLCLTACQFSSERACEWSRSHVVWYSLVVWGGSFWAHLCVRLCMLAVEFCSVMVGYDRGTGMVICACLQMGMGLILVLAFNLGYRILRPYLFPSAQCLGGIQFCCLSVFSVLWSWDFVSSRFQQVCCFGAYFVTLFLLLCSIRTLGVISHIGVAVAAFWLDIPGRWSMRWG